MPAIFRQFRSACALTAFLSASCYITFSGIAMASPPQNIANKITDNDQLFQNELPSKGRVDAQISKMMRLCISTDSKPGELQRNAKTIRQYLGPSLKNIAITSATQFETRDVFNVAKTAISNMLKKSPKYFYRYEPWAEAIRPDFLARLDFANGQTGILSCTYDHICFQDQNGTHWWTRVANSDDLNQ